MAQPAQIPPVEATPAENVSKPLPATERDFHTRPSRTQSSTFRIGLAIAVVVLLIAGIFVYRYVTSYESTDDAQVDGHVNTISARITGHVIKLNVDDNQYVQAGTVLLEIDPADYQVAYDSAKADY
jgi:membrane fusion protein, multidrug efflux system